jgi:hypothetical protein
MKNMTPTEYERLAAQLDAVAGTPENVEPTTTPEAWPEPREIKAELPPAPPFDAKVLLPPTLADFVLDEADRMPSSPDFIAAALLVALGS